ATHGALLVEDGRERAGVVAAILGDALRAGVLAFLDAVEDWGGGRCEMGGARLHGLRIAFPQLQPLTSHLARRQQVLVGQCMHRLAETVSESRRVSKGDVLLYVSSPAHVA